jgi:hypothetical protein
MTITPNRVLKKRDYSGFASANYRSITRVWALSPDSIKVERQQSTTNGGLFTFLQARVSLGVKVRFGQVFKPDTF